MKNIGLILACVLISGCATYAPISFEEQCASRGMVLEGVDTDSGSSYTYNQKLGAFNSFSSSQNVRCVKPKTEIEKCEIKKTRAASIPKYEYNETVPSGRFLTGLGYFLYVVPGVFAKIHYDNKKEDAVKESRIIEDLSEGMCKP